MRFHNLCLLNRLQPKLTQKHYNRFTQVLTKSNSSADKILKGKINTIHIRSTRRELQGRFKKTLLQLLIPLASPIAEQVFTSCPKSYFGNTEGAIRYQTNFHLAEFFPLSNHELAI